MPTHRSFGSRLIEHSFVRQLNGQAQLAFEPTGVVCVLDIPLAALKPLRPAEAFAVAMVTRAPARPLRTISAKPDVALFSATRTAYIQFAGASRIWR